ncbi:hypothetical protein BT69DRAFT_331248 [Atractiella rhizophila]|nr:hypothetical protein BT69DRAFT_331248 [Atractiella rhizophila]
MHLQMLSKASSSLPNVNKPRHRARMEEHYASLNNRFTSRKSQQVRKIIMAATFPEFYSISEADRLHDNVDEQRDRNYRWDGTPNLQPHYHRVGWKLRAGHYEAIRWTGSRPLDVERRTAWAWWLIGIMSSLLNEWPENCMDHLMPCSEVHFVIAKVTGAYDEINE